MLKIPKARLFGMFFVIAFTGAYGEMSVASGFKPFSMSGGYAGYHCSGTTEFSRASRMKAVGGCGSDNNELFGPPRKIEIISNEDYEGALSRAQSLGYDRYCVQMHWGYHEMICERRENYWY